MTALVVQALKTLGRKNVTPEIIDALSTRRSNADKSTLLREATESTDWVYGVIKKLSWNTT